MSLAVLAFVPFLAAPFIRFAGGPRAIAPLGDLDGDGRADFALTSCSDGSSKVATEAWICSGRDGRILVRLTGMHWSETLGFDHFNGSAARAADLDGDGIRDVAISTNAVELALAVDPNRPRQGARGSVVRIHSTRDGKLLRALTAPEPRADDRFGYELADAGDVDGDGAADLLVGAPGLERAFLFSGKSGALIREFTPPHAGGQFGTAVCGGVDFDGDGTLDLAIGAPCWKAGGAREEIALGFVALFSGKDGRSLIVLQGSPASWYGGGLATSLAALRDVNGDGRPELLAGADNEASEGRVRLYSGTTSTPFSILKPDPADWGRFGTSVAAAGDLDGDGVPDFFVGDSSSSIDDEMPRGQACGGVAAYSGKTRMRLYMRYGNSGFDFLGRSLACVGDLDGDGVDDVVAEAGAYFRAISGKKGVKLYDVSRVVAPPVPGPSAPK